MRRLSIALLIAGIVAALALSGCGGGGGSSSNPPTSPGGDGGGSNPPPLNPTYVQLVGKVVSSQTGLGVADVHVWFGEAPYGPVEAVSTANGSFTLTLPQSKTVLDMFPQPATYAFRIDSTMAGVNYPPYLPVQYWGETYMQDSIRIDAKPDTLAVLSGQSTNLGTITLSYYDPSGPPPPPF